MNVLDLFSGIGGFSLGLERAGMRTVAFCEIDSYCQAVLRKHWPNVPIFGNITTLTADKLASTYHCGGKYYPQVICGGFPCQDISIAGKGAGIEGARSGLWSEFARIIGEVRPRYVIVENVSALLGRGIERVLGDLAALGFDAEWHCIPASAVGAPHRRDRIWIVANAAGNRECGETAQQASARQRRHQSGNGGKDVAHAHSNNGQRRLSALQMGRFGIAREIANYGDAGRTQWLIEPDLGRVANGVPFRVDRLRSLGNAIVPQIAEIIGKAIRAQGT